MPGIDAAERLLIEAAQKDPGRFAELYEKNFERVYAFIARRVNERAEAEDLTSEVFHQAFANHARFEWRGAPFAAWLFRIARNAIIDRAKRAAKEAEIPPIVDVPSEAGLARRSNTAHGSSAWLTGFRQISAGSSRCDSQKRRVFVK